MGTRDHFTNNVVGYVALFVALSGTAWAAGEIGTKEIRDDQVKSADVRDDTLRGGGLGAVDLAAGSVGTSEIQQDSLDSSDIAPGAVGASELGTDSVNAASVIDDSLGGTDIQEQTLGTVPLASQAANAATVGGRSAQELRVNANGNEVSPVRDDETPLSSNYVKVMGTNVPEQTPSGVTSDLIAMATVLIRDRSGSAGGEEVLCYLTASGNGTLTRISSIGHVVNDSSSSYSTLTLIGHADELRSGLYSAGVWCRESEIPQTSYFDGGDITLMTLPASG
jgi:hypothetical protein